MKVCRRRLRPASVVDRVLACGCGSRVDAFHLSPCIHPNRLPLAFRPHSSRTQQHTHTQAAEVDIPINKRCDDHVVLLLLPHHPTPRRPVATTSDEHCWVVESVAAEPPKFARSDPSLVRLEPGFDRSRRGTEVLLSGWSGWLSAAAASSPRLQQQPHTRPVSFPAANGWTAGSSNGQRPPRSHSFTYPSSFPIPNRSQATAIPAAG